MSILQGLGVVQTFATERWTLKVEKNTRSESKAEEVKEEKKSESH